MEAIKELEDIIKYLGRILQKSHHHKIDSEESGVYLDIRIWCNIWRTEQKIDGVIYVSNCKWF